MERLPESLPRMSMIASVGERGREVREFLHHSLGDGLSKSVLVVSTSDVSPALQIKGVEAAMAVAEYFRDQGLNVLVMTDSLTRLAMAQRQIGLAAGEPPTTKGYPPSVFTMLPRLLERGGPGEDGQGTITSVSTILVEGDDMNDPVGDTVRGIVDGHGFVSPFGLADITLPLMCWSWFVRCHPHVPRSTSPPPLAFVGSWRSTKRMKNSSVLGHTRREVMLRLTRPSS